MLHIQNVRKLLSISFLFNVMNLLYLLIILMAKIFKLSKQNRDQSQPSDLIDFEE